MSNDNPNDIEIIEPQNITRPVARNLNQFTYTPPIFRENNATKYHTLKKFFQNYRTLQGKYAASLKESAMRRESRREQQLLEKRLQILPEEQQPPPSIFEKFVEKSIDIAAGYATHGLSQPAMDAISTLTKKPELESVGKAVISGTRKATTLLKDTYDKITKKIKIGEQPPIQEERIPLQNIPPSKVNSPRPPSPKPQTIKKPQTEKHTKSKKQEIYEIKDEIVHLKEKKDTRKKIKNLMNKKLLEQPQIPKPTIPLPNIEQPIPQKIQIEEEPPIQEPVQQPIIQQHPQELILQSNNGHTGSFSTPQDIMPYGKKPVE